MGQLARAARSSGTDGLPASYVTACGEEDPPWYVQGTCATGSRWMKLDGERIQDRSEDIVLLNWYTYILYINTYIYIYI